MDYHRDQRRNFKKTRRDHVEHRNEDYSSYTAPERPQRQPERQERPQRMDDLALLQTLPNVQFTETDGVYNIKIASSFGPREVEWNRSSNEWKALNGRGGYGKGAGRGLHSMARYFQLVPKTST